MGLGVGVGWGEVVEGAGRVRVRLDEWRWGPVHDRRLGGGGCAALGWVSSRAGRLGSALHSMGRTAAAPASRAQAPAPPWPDDMRPAHPGMQHSVRTRGIVRAGVQQHHAAGGRLAERVAHALKVEPLGLLVVVWVAAQHGVLSKAFGVSVVHTSALRWHWRLIGTRGRLGASREGAVAG